MSTIDGAKDGHEADAPHDNPTLRTIRLDTVERALEDIAAGKAVVVVDDEDRENEGDIIFAASKATPELMAWTIRHSSGVICVPMPGEMLDRLEIPLMTPHNKDAYRTAYTLSVDARDGVSTGISAADRARGDVGLGLVDQGGHRDRQQVGLQQLALPGPLAVPQRRADRECGVQPGEDVEHRDPRAERRPVDVAGQAHQAAVGLDQQVVTRHFGHGSSAALPKN